MKKILSIAYYTFVESVRNRIFYVLVLFGVVVIGTSLLLAALGGQQSQRILLDTGLAAMEFFALLTVGFAAVTLVLEEMESKTIYLVLTRPVSRSAYLTGRFLGLLFAVYCGLALMGVVHLALLLANGWAFMPRYLLAVALAAGKITVIGSLAVFFSLFSSSAVSSVSFTVFLWVLGHFSEEIRFLGHKATGIVPKTFATAVYYLVPNLQYFNLRDFWGVPGIMGGWIIFVFAYGALYSAFFLALSLWLFKRKEF
jgi:ABC-type transport system involved in multi-copper enzyme maturation permease subunit